MQEVITLACTKCKRKNYTSKKNKKNTKERIELMKFCPWDRKHTKHKEEK
ncbi:MAG: 50S ribosomal protein L33 [Candidatus Margulisiibacteriota bacterium]